MPKRSKSQAMSSKSLDSDDTSPCKSCTKPCSDDHQAFECDSCQAWWHIKCAKVSEDIYEFYTNAQMNDFGFKWHCPKCKAEDSNSEVKHLEKRIDELQGFLLKKMEGLEQKLTSHTNSLTSGISNLKSSYSEVVHQNKAERCETKKVISSISENLDNFRSNVKKKLDEDAEIKMKKQKEMNVLVFNLPETINNDGNIDKSSEGYQKDMNKLKKVLSDKISLKKEGLNAVYRNGKWNSERPRPVVMKFSTIEKKQEILKLRNLVYKTDDNKDDPKEIKNEAVKDDPKENQNGDDIDKEKSEEDDAIKIFISPDRTQQQRDAHKILVNELKRRKKEGEKDIYIRAGEIVKQFSPFRQSPQLFWGESK